jgi:DNA-binding IclR family transcriptional regulator
MELVPLTEKTIISKTRLLEAIEVIRGNDSVLVIDELEEGLSGVGVPVRQDGRLIGMLATYLPTVRLTPTVKERALGSLRRGAAELATPSNFNIR